MSERRRIRGRKPQKDNRIQSKETPNYDQNIPVFSLEKLQQGKYCLSSLDQEHKAMFANAIFRRRAITWADLKGADRHGIGFEKIAKHSINAAIPRFVTPDVSSFIAFRYHGKRAMVGMRHKDIFYVLWFDCDFSLYNH